MEDRPRISAPSRARPASPGFALPATLFVLSILSLLAATGFLVSWLEVRSSAAFGAGTAAFYVADGGLATALAARPPASPAAIAVGAGVADVRFERLLRPAVGEALYRVVSEGTVLARGVPVTRGVSRIAWVGDPPRAAAALLVADTLRVFPTTGAVSGLDAGGCGPGSLPGVASWRPFTPGAGLLVIGAPPVDTLAASRSVAELTGIRWADLFPPDGPTPDAIVPSDPWPAAGAPVFVRLDAPATLGPAESGRGALVAADDLVLADGFRWTGLLLVGGSLTITGDVAVRGAVATGLDPGRAGMGDLGPGPVAISFDSCAVAGAAARLAPFPAAVPGTWRERW